MDVKYLLELLTVSVLVTTSSGQADGVFGPWTDWSTNDQCPVTCGGGTRLFTKTRECDSPPPTLGGRDCRGASSERKYENCSVEPCPIDGQWSSWKEWTTAECSVSCGGGTAQKIRHRLCDNPEPQYGGEVCAGPENNTELINCGSDPCPVDGGWSLWNEWTRPPCPVTCGTATVLRTRSRECDDPAPQYGGAVCQGGDKETESLSCGTHPCPIDGDWSIWSEWTLLVCPVSCGGSLVKRIRHRKCETPAPQFGGRQCQGSDNQSEFVQCGTDPCPVDGSWSVWKEWIVAPCPVTCGGTTIPQTRHRECDTPAPRFGGAQCQGSTISSSLARCGTKTCPGVSWTPIIIGLSLGSVLLLFLVDLAIYCWRRKSIADHQNRSNNTGLSEYTEPRSQTVSDVSNVYSELAEERAGSLRHQRRHSEKHEYTSDHHTTVTSSVGNNHQEHSSHSFNEVLYHQKVHIRM